MPRPAESRIPPVADDVHLRLLSRHEKHRGRRNQYAKTYVKAGVKLDYWWMDAGWYPCGDVGERRNMAARPNAIPKASSRSADYVHSQGMKLVVWFEPERVTADTWLAKNHPEWLFGGSGRTRC